jgi:hypothetical protein
VRAYLYYAKAIADISPEYDDCPLFCPAGYENGSECESCPVKEARADLDEGLSENLSTLLKENSARYPMNRLIGQVIDVSEMADVDASDRTIITDKLVRILKSERNRLDRIDSWNRRQSQPK